MCNLITRVFARVATFIVAGAEMYVKDITPRTVIPVLFRTRALHNKFKNVTVKVGQTASILPTKNPPTNSSQVRRVCVCRICMACEKYASCTCGHYTHARPQLPCMGNDSQFNHCKMLFNYVILHAVCIVPPPHQPHAIPLNMIAFSHRSARTCGSTTLRHTSTRTHIKTRV